MIDCKEILNFVDASLEKISKKSINCLGIEERNFLDIMSPHIGKSDPLSEIPFNPKLVVYLFKGWKTGSVYSKVGGNGENAIYQVINTGINPEPFGSINVVFWLQENRTEYRVPYNKVIESLPETMSDFVKHMNTFGILVEMRSGPYKD